MPYKMKDSDGNVFEEYKGFSPYRAGDRYIAIATFDGEPDIYTHDAGAGLADVDSEIRRKYRDDYSREPESLVHYIASAGS